MDETTAVKERPILFSAPMVRAIIEGRKTQTRRVIKRVFPVEIDGESVDCIKDWDGGPSRLDIAPRDWEMCPYGQPGDRLWVRETCSINDTSEPPSERYQFLAEIRYPADGAVVRKSVDLDCWRTAYENFAHRLTPSIHMPRWASRLTLEIAGVRVERLHDISEADKAAEGATTDRPFGTVWRKINTKTGVRWEDNPWVWVVEFRRVTEPAG